MKAIALINAAAGTSTGEDPVHVARQALAAAGVDGEVRPVDGARLQGAARQALADGADLVIVGGGDGTVSAVAGVLAGTGAALGVLPMGTLNHFARDLNIPTRLDDAARLIAAGSPRPVDVGEVNGRRFVNNASIGLYPHIVSHRQRQQQRLGRNKWVAMLVAAAWVFRRYPVVTIVLHTGERVIRAPRRSSSSATTITPCTRWPPAGAIGWTAASCAPTSPTVPAASACSS